MSLFLLRFSLMQCKRIAQNLQDMSPLTKTQPSLPAP